jgi:enoyl-CoA hydratase
MTAAPQTRRMHDHLEETRHPGGVVVFRIDREEALGALSRSILTTLDRELVRLAGDETIRVLILTGTGKGFIAGADIGEYHGVTQEEFDDYQRLGRRVFSALEALPQFTIAAVNGFALGGGFEIALCCDAIVASERAKFGLPEVRLGLLPGGGGTQRLGRALGRRFTTQLIVTGELVRASELDRRGLLAGVHPPEEVLSEALALAGVVASNAPLPVRHAKRLVADGLELPYDEALTMEQEVLSALFATADAKEGIDAFVSKREPRFTGS